MKEYTLDTNVIAYFLKGMYDIDKRLSEIIKAGDRIIINPISYYEICRGLLAINSLKKLEAFQELCRTFGVAEMKKDFLDEAAKIYSELKIRGELVEDADIFIAAMCLRRNCILATNNVRHFKRIEGLIIENWVEQSA